MLKIAVIIPAYNEEKSISKVVEGINNLNLGDNILKQVVVVNDCSTDSTHKVTATLNCITLNLPVNLGIGGAVQTGLKYAFLHQFDYAVQIDGDGQHPPKELPKLIDVMFKKNADIVIGSRYLEKKGFQSSFMRRVGINYFKMIINLLCHIKITDATSGFRLFNKKALAFANAYYPDEYPEPESIIYFKFNNLKIVETPVLMVERKEGKSSINNFSALYYMLKVTLAVVFTSIKVKFSSKNKV